MKPFRVFPSVEKIVIACCCVIAFLTELAISHSDTPLYGDGFRGIYSYTVLMSTAIAAMFMTGIKKKFDSVFFVPIIIFTYIVINAYTLSFPKIFDSVYSMMRIMVFLTLTAMGQAKVFEIFRKYMIVMSVLGIIAFAAYVLSIPLPHKVTSYYSSSIYAQYVNYGFSFLFSEFGAIRLCGLFNEPGAMGTLIGLILVTENFSLKRKGNIIMMVAGILTFSMAFFAIIIISYIVRSYKRPKVMTSFFLLLLFFVYLSFQKFDNPILAAFFGRFSLEDDGTLSMFSRSTEVIDNYFNNLWSGDHFLLGYGSGFVSSLEQGGTSTYKTLFIDYGVGGCFIILGYMIWQAFKKAKGSITAISLVICFIASIYQRPNIFTMVYFMILFGGIEYVQQKNTVSAVKERIHHKLHSQPQLS